MYVSSVKLKADFWWHLDISPTNNYLDCGQVEDSDYIVLGDHSRSAAQKEELNKIKENMMNKAIQVVNGMSDGKRRQNILELQQKTMEQRKMNDVARKWKSKACP